jgi:hypothetical protein
MSSYTIAKEEYIKAAGLVAGLAEALQIWIYDYETGRNSIASDYYRKFEQMYKMNALSVLEQYRGDEVGAPSTDSNEYYKSFEKCQKIGLSVGYTLEGLKEVIAELDKFFGSAIYQTEKIEYMTNMQYYFDRILVELYGKAYKHEAKSWGSLELDHINVRQVQRIL